MRVLLAVILLLCATPALADGLRVEASVGQCSYQLAPDASWHYEYGGYRTDMRLRPACGAIGASYWRHSLGVRASYVDLGTVTADNSYPVDEGAYFAAKDAHTAVASGTASYQGHGTHRGVTLGVAAERRLSGAFFLTGETGIAYLHNTWHVPQFDNWAHADGWKATPYFGAGVRYGMLTLSARVYTNVITSQAKENPMYVGPTSGPVVQMLVGVSIPLESKQRAARAARAK